MPSAGEIDITLYRYNWQVRFQAIVTKLHCEFVAGNNFIKVYSIIQDFENKTITVKRSIQFLKQTNSFHSPHSQTTLKFKTIISRSSCLVRNYSKLFLIQRALLFLQNHGSKTNHSHSHNFNSAR